MRFNLVRPVFVLAALLLAAFACNLGSGDQNTQPTPTPFPSLTPSLAAATTPTPTLAPTLTPTRAALPNSGQVPPTQTNCLPQTGWPVYTVVAGDTLGVIAQRSGSTVAQLATANCLSNAELIYVGQKLYVPRLPVTLTPTSAGTPFTPQTAVPTQDLDAPIITQNLTVQPYWLDSSNRATTYSDTIRISLGEVLNADTVKFYVNDPNGSSLIYIGEDVDPWDGAFVDYDFPEPGSYTFSAVAANDKVLANTNSFTVRYDPSFSPPGGQRNLLTITPYTQFEGGWYTLKIGTTVTITWNDAPRGATRVDFTLTPTGTGTADLAQTIGSDVNPADGASIAWGVTGGALGHLQAVATMPDGSTQTSEYANVVSDN
jgi:hypothetical protein